MQKKKRFTDIYKNDPTFSPELREVKARKILAVIRNHKGRDLSKFSCLDVGSSVGLISEFFSRYFGKVVGVDVDERAIKIARSRVKVRNLSFLVSSENRIPVKKETFDVAIFNQVYEHAENPEKLMKEIKRVLKTGGVCYFGARNKYWFFDGHYPLPFLSYLSDKWANKYFRLFTGRKEYDIRLFSYQELMKLIRKVGFGSHDYSLKVIKEPRNYNATDVVPTFMGINYFILLLAKVFYGLIPNYIWILEKPDLK